MTHVTPSSLTLNTIKFILRLNSKIELLILEKAIPESYYNDVIKWQSNGCSITYSRLLV